MRDFQTIQARKGQDEWRTNNRKAIVNGLMTPMINHLENTKRKIIEEHVNLTHTDGFYANGAFYTNVAVKGVAQSKMQSMPIHDSLKDQFQNYMNQVKDIVADKTSFDQAFSLVLKYCQNDQDIRNEFPEPMATILGSPAHLLDRTAPELTKMTSPLHRAQFAKVMEKVYFYMATALLG